MRTIGLIGGMSWESTVTYYQIINEVVAGQLGGLHSARCVLYSVDFDEIERCQSSGDWERAGEILAGAGAGGRRAHRHLHQHDAQGRGCRHVRGKRPFVAHPGADGRRARSRGRADVRTVGLLGTRYTMQQDFYTGVLEARGIRVLTPGERDRALVNRIIFDELCRGDIRDESRAEYLRVIDELAARGVQGVILGCTEIGLLVRQSDTPVPLFDTTQIHARGAALAALA